MPILCRLLRFSRATALTTIRFSRLDATPMLAAAAFTDARSAMRAQRCATRCRRLSGADTRADVHMPQPAAAMRRLLRFTRERLRERCLFSRGARRRSSMPILPRNAEDETAAF